MSDETLFRICNLAVLPAWTLLLAAPRWKWTHRVAMFLPAALAIAYIWAFIESFDGLHASFTSLSDVVYLFHKPSAVLAGWIHYLAFDLFTGAWMVRDSRRLQIVHLAVIPCLLLTFILGPVGLLTYLSLRTGLRRTAEPRE